MLSRNGVEAKHLRFFVATLLRMTGIFILLGALSLEHAVERALQINQDGLIIE
jgi:hypothetical protein